MFIWGRVRGDIVALSALMVLTATGILTTNEALSGFSSPIVIMMVGLFVVGGAILQTGLAQTVGNSISQLAKGVGNIFYRSFCEQHRNCGNNDAYSDEYGCKLRHTLFATADAYSLCW